MATANLGPAKKELRATGFEYSPSFRDTTNVATSVIVGVSRFTRSGDIVTVMGQVTIDPTAAAATVFGISLPAGNLIANVGATADIQGMLTNDDGDVGVIIGDATNEEAQANYITSVDTASVVAFRFTYTADVLPA